jgi:hypothetical protein
MGVEGGVSFGICKRLGISDGDERERAALSYWSDGMAACRRDPYMWASARPLGPFSQKPIPPNA